MKIIGLTTAALLGVLYANADRASADPVFGFWLQVPLDGDGQTEVWTREAGARGGC